MVISLLVSGGGAVQTASQWLPGVAGDATERGNRPPIGVALTSVLVNAAAHEEAVVAEVAESATDARMNCVLVGRRVGCQVPPRDSGMLTFC